MRCNVGVEAKFLADNHLIAEYRELPMIIGSLRYNNWLIKSAIPSQFSLGTGHINFFKNKLYYVKHRHIHVKTEMLARGFKHDALTINLDNISADLLWDWVPTQSDSYIIRKRIAEKLRLKPYLYRYNRAKIVDIEDFINQMMLSEANYV